MPLQCAVQDMLMQETRARHVDHHTNSPSIDRLVVADGRAWRAASPTRLRSDLHWRCASLRLTALRCCYSPSSLARYLTRAAMVGGMSPSEPRIVEWAAIDSAATRSHECLYSNGGAAVGTASTRLRMYQQLYLSGCIALAVWKAPT